MYFKGCENLASKQPTMRPLLERLDAELFAMGIAGEFVVDDLRQQHRRARGEVESHRAGIFEPAAFRNEAHAPYAFPCPDADARHDPHAVDRLVRRDRYKSRVDAVSLQKLRGARRGVVENDLDVPVVRPVKEAPDQRCGVGITGGRDSRSAAHCKSYARPKRGNIFTKICTPDGVTLANYPAAASPANTS